MYLNTKQITEFKNRYCGERAFLVGNGPSLAKTPMSQLGDEYTFAMNKINHIYQSTSWRPTFYYVSQPPNHPENPEKEGYISENIEIGTTCFLRSHYKDRFSGENVYFLNIVNLHDVDIFDDLVGEDIDQVDIEFLKEFWSDDLSTAVYHYHTMYGVIQLAKYMGFEDLYLVGCDLGFEYFAPHMIFRSGMDPNRYRKTNRPNKSVYTYLQKAKSEATLLRSFINGLALSIIENPVFNRLLNKFLSNNDSYFTKDYTKRFRVHDGHRVNNEIETSHKIAKRICEIDGLKIYNSTIGGDLTVYKRKSIDSIFS